MRTLKMVMSTITLGLSAMVLFQSCAAGASNVLSNNGESSGAAGFFVAIMMIAGGVINIATRKSETKGGSIAGLVVFVLAALIGFTMAGSFADLKIWAAWCLIMAIIDVIAILKTRKDNNLPEEGK